ncbi:MAG: bifunctional phosphoribosylaminoimidazolecarboxamide formyltransferase/IMP cyclohydrolase [Acidimicrobiales bacterium]|nr:bifunctional phosphoribosylaminoimidazolecarboxamide formyltransferase/IMP cyclohydrolase [Acidimicrobiales bacterium]
MKALLSVYDKTGVVELAQGLRELGWDLLSSGGTASVIADAGIPVTEVAELTGFPAIIGHRVVTLHPKVHGGILADRSNPDHLADMATYGIEGIDLVVVNLYPFRSDPSIELIDIGGPALIRAAAKNHAYVGVVTDPSDYQPILSELRTAGSLSSETRRRLAQAAFAATAAYDTAIAAWLAETGPSRDDRQADSNDDHGASEDVETWLPPSISLTLRRAQVLRYGENPHQLGARYTTDGESGWWASAIQHGGKEMSYLNVYDADAAWRLVHELGDEPAAVVIKHANPCGAAIADDITTAYRRAHECDPVSAFGGIVAVNRPVSEEMADALKSVFTEVLIAPGFEGDALTRLMEKRNLRILEATPPGTAERTLRSIDGGYLVQTPDRVTADPSAWQVVTKAKVTDQQWYDVVMAWRLVARVTSNAIVLVRDRQAFGIGCGQQNRRDAGRLACEKAAGRAKGGVYASDAFFPFPDGLEPAIEAGASVVVQPGGSVRDEEVIAAADDAGLAMIFTGERHFRH